MRATITKPDGTRIDLEGTAEEIAQVVGVPSPVPQFVPIPTLVPAPPHRDTVPPMYPSPYPCPTQPMWPPADPYCVPTWKVQPFLAPGTVTCGSSS